MGERIDELEKNIAELMTNGPLDSTTDQRSPVENRNGFNNSKSQVRNGYY